MNALVQQDGVGPFIAKIPLLFADLAMIALLYRQARKRHSMRFAFIAAASFALSPALLYNGVIWGQTDGFVALPLLVALFAVIEERYILGGVSLALAVLIKPQPVVFVPLFLLYIWRWAGREQFVRFTVAGLVTTLVVALPVLIPNFQLPDMIHNMQAASYNDNLSLSSDAFNFWWLIGRGKEAIGSTFLGLRSGLIGEALFGAVLVLCGALIWRRRDPAVFALALAVALFGFFMFMGGQHERYLFLFVPLALASVILARRDADGRVDRALPGGNGALFPEHAGGRRRRLFRGGTDHPLRLAAHTQRIYRGQLHFAERDAGLPPPDRVPLCPLRHARPVGRTARASDAIHSAAGA